LEEKAPRDPRCPFQVPADAFQQSDLAAIRPCAELHHVSDGGELVADLAEVNRGRGDQIFAGDGLVILSSGELVAG